MQCLLLLRCSHTHVGVGAQCHCRHHGALQTALASGHKAIIWLLLDKDADINAQGGHFGSVLEAASAGGHKAVVRLLLDKDTDVNAQGGPFSSALQVASDGGYEAVIWLLLDKDMDVNMHAPMRGMTHSQGDGMLTRGWHAHEGTARSQGDGALTRGRVTACS